MQGPLSGIRVLDLGYFLAGPFGAMVLGDLGADVIKIESPVGDGSRLRETPSHKGESSHYLAWNRNKRSIVLDLWTPTGKEAFYDLVKVSDVVWNNFRPSVVGRLGIDYERLKAVNPRIVCTNITGYGPSGPYSHMPSNDSVIAGLSGILSVTGEPKGPPIRPGPAISDLTSGLYAVVATVSALFERDRTGVGQDINISMLGASVALMGYHIAWYTMSGKMLGPMGSGYGAAIPFGAFRTKDSYVVLGPCWPRIARVIGKEWLIDDPRFKTLAGRLEYREELNAEVEKGLMILTTEEWLPILEAEDIVAGPLKNVAEVVADPQVNHLNMILSIEHPLGGTIKVAGNPIMMPSLKSTHMAPPMLGQHTDKILSELLGYSNDKIAKLKQEQAANAESLKQHVQKER